MYHVSAEGVDERMINVHYYYYYYKHVAYKVLLLVSKEKVATLKFYWATPGRSAHLPADSPATQRSNIDL